MKIALGFFVLLAAVEVNAQVGAGDDGLLTLGGHSSIPRGIRTSQFTLTQTYSENERAEGTTYLETQLGYSRRWKQLSLGLTANFRHIRSVNFVGAGPEFRSISQPMDGGKVPRIQLSPGDDWRDPISHTGLGDIRLQGDYLMGRFGRYGLHAAVSMPLGTMDRTRSVAIQTTLGVPSAMLGASIEGISWHIPPQQSFPQTPQATGFMLRYGASLAYRTHFGANAMGFDRADDLALTTRAQTMYGPIRVGFDLSGVYHLASDHTDTNTFTFVGHQGEGYVINGGVSLSVGGGAEPYIDERFPISVSLMASTPLTQSRAMKGYLYRSWLLGLRVAYTYW